MRYRWSTGGVATGLGSFYKSYNSSIWVGWPGIAWEEVKGNEKNLETKLMSEFGCYPVHLSRRDVEKYYHGFSNKTLWPLFHYFIQYVVYDKSFWEAYVHVNGLFSKAIFDIAKEDDIIWIHDYHLMLLPKLIREKLPDATIGFFNHIPFPSFEIARLLPWRKEILEGLLGADVIGFHTYDYTRHFLSSVHRLLGYEHSLGQIAGGDRIIRADAFPMGIDCEQFSKATYDPQVQKEVTRLRKKVGGRRVILSVDRLDYTKGIPQRLEVFNAFLHTNPEYKEKVVYILVAVPSRTNVEHYRLLKKEVDELVGRINGRYGTVGWTPVQYLYRSLPFHALISLYSVADVCVVTPLRDGMNLIAKEYIATRTDGSGVLILSEMAGAAAELGEAISVSPTNREEMVEALEKALTMSDREQIERMMPMQKRIQRYNVMRWSEDFMDKLVSTKRLQKEMRAKILTPEVKRRLVSDYLRAERRLLLLDYDGTLSPFFERPEDAKPGDELLRLLERLAEDPKNEVVLISGRDRDTLDEWFGGLPLSFVAEHGVWIKEEEWDMVEPLANDWKGEIQPILELCVDRTPGSFIEEKEFSLVWHYRKADADLGAIRARELTHELVSLTANLNLQVLEGSKVVEVKNIGINKGRAALRWIRKERWGFMLAIGDDTTDEDIFDVLPKTAYSIRVGLAPSLAKFNLESPGGVLLLLRELTLGS